MPFQIVVPPTREAPAAVSVFAPLPADATHCGRKKYNIDDITYRIKIEQPTYYIAPADEVLLIT